MLASKEDGGTVDQDKNGRLVFFIKHAVFNKMEERFIKIKIKNRL